MNCLPHGGIHFDEAFNKIDETSFRIAEERLPAVLSATGPPAKGGGKSETPQPKVDNATNQAVHQMRMNNEDFLKRQEATLKAQGVGQVNVDDDKGKGKGKNKGKGEAKRGAPWVAEAKAYNQNWNGNGGKGANNQQQKGQL